MNPDFEMPRQCEWIQRISEIQEVLAASPDTLLDRAAIEQVFHVSRRHASRLLQQFGPSTVGGAMVIGSRELLGKLKQVRKNEAVTFELERRQRLEQKLSEARREIRARRVVIAPAATLEAPPTLRELPGEIQLSPGELRVRFTSPTELLQRLLLLAEAISEDWVNFEAQASEPE
jgi:AraC-like DNA-binding protein